MFKLQKCLTNFNSLWNRVLESFDLGSNPLSLNHYMLSRKLLNFSESVSSFVKWGENILLARLFEDHTYCINMSMTYIRIVSKQTQESMIFVQFYSSPNTLIPHTPKL